MMLTEEDIIKGCQKGDPVAQKKLYEKYASKMFGVCIRYFKSTEEAEDALQEGFIRLFKYIGQYRGDGSFEGWMRRIIVNTALNYHKSILKHQYHTNYQEVEELIEDERIAYDPMHVEFLLKVIQQMPEGYRVIFNLFEIEGYSHKEIANMLKISVNTSKSQLMKSKRYIQRQLEKINELKY